MSRGTDRRSRASRSEIRVAAGQGHLKFGARADAGHPAYAGRAATPAKISPAARPRPGSEPGSWTGVWGSPPGRPASPTRPPPHGAGTEPIRAPPWTRVVVARTLSVGSAARMSPVPAQLGPVRLTSAVRWRPTSTGPTGDVGVSVRTLVLAPPARSKVPGALAAEAGPWSELWRTSARWARLASLSRTAIALLANGGAAWASGNRAASGETPLSVPPVMASAAGSSVEGGTPMSVGGEAAARVVLGVVRPASRSARAWATQRSRASAKPGLKAVPTASTPNPASVSAPVSLVQPTSVPPMVSALPSPGSAQAVAEAGVPRAGPRVTGSEREPKALAGVAGSGPRRVAPVSVDATPWEEDRTGTGTWACSGRGMPGPQPEPTWTPAAARWSGPTTVGGLYTPPGRPVVTAGVGVGTTDRPGAAGPVDPWWEPSALGSSRSTERWAVGSTGVQSAGPAEGRCPGPSAVQLDPAQQAGPPGVEEPAERPGLGHSLGWPGPARATASSGLGRSLGWPGPGAATGGPGPGASTGGPRRPLEPSTGSPGRPPWTVAPRRDRSTRRGAASGTPPRWRRPRQPSPQLPARRRPWRRWLPLRELPVPASGRWGHVGCLRPA